METAFGQSQKDLKEAAQELADAEKDLSLAEIDLAYATALAWNYYRYVWLPLAASGAGTLVAHFIMAALVLGVLIATIQMSIASGKVADARKKLKEARKERKDIASELAELKRSKKLIANNIAQMEAYLASLRPLDVIIIELHEVCKEIDRLKALVIERELAIQALKNNIAKLDDDIKDCEKDLDEACKYFWENIAPNAVRYGKAKARISTLWGI